MARNLPDDVNVSNKKAPWNQTEPNNPYLCPECGNRYGPRVSGVNPECPNCGVEMARY